MKIFLHVEKIEELFFVMVLLVDEESCYIVAIVGNGLLIGMKYRECICVCVRLDLLVPYLELLLGETTKVTHEASTWVVDGQKNVTLHDMDRR